MSALRKHDTRIPRRPLLWLAAALVFTVPPLFGALAPWVPGLLLVTIAAKFWMEPRGYRLRSVVLKLVLAALALGAIVLSYGSLKGIEPGISLVVVLMALKIVEAHTAREFLFMVMLSWIICLCGLFLAQSLTISFCLLLAFVLLLAALVQFHRGSAVGDLRPPLRLACSLILQALPLIVLLFFVFPRITTGFRLLTPGSESTAGFSDELEPGSVEKLALSPAIAFRAEFPDGKIPRPAELYWRGLVMWNGNGMRWRAPSAPAILPHRQDAAPGQTLRQLITLEPHGGRWMFALDWPAAAPSGAARAPGDYLWSWQPITKPRRYEVTSVVKRGSQELSARERTLILEVPRGITPKVRALAEEWATAGKPEAVVQRGLAFFRDQHFRYSLSPGTYQKNDLEDFLFHRRLGFCEHYASSFATLMRLAGVPSRVIVGYMGGEFNSVGHFFLVRQSDTHAWCEVWLPGSGWTRVDPTAVVAPERISLGLDSYLESTAASGETVRQNGFGRALSRQPALARLRLAWQTLNYEWDTSVLSFDADAQQAFASELGMAGVTPLVLTLLSAILLVLLVMVVALWLHLRGKSRPDEVTLLYRRFCRRAARLGAAREEWEGPSRFARRAARVLPKESARIARIVEHYIKLRYALSPDPSLRQALRAEVKAFGAG